MSIWWTLHLRREAASVPFARRMLLGAMDTAGVDPDISHDIAVALSEACSNVVQHAAGGVGDYQVSARIEGDSCRVEVRDSGPGFPEAEPGLGAVHNVEVFPGAMPRSTDQATHARGGDDHTFPVCRATAWPVETAESGRGMYLIEALVDHVQFGNHPDRGAVVSFDKALKWREDALLKVS